MIKVELYAANITIVQVSPREGVYTISAVPAIRAPPTHVATRWINTEQHDDDKIIQYYQFRKMMLSKFINSKERVYQCCLM